MKELPGAGEMLISAEFAPSEERSVQRAIRSQEPDRMPKRHGLTMGDRRKKLAPLAIPNGASLVLLGSFPHYSIEPVSAYGNSVSRVSELQVSCSWLAGRGLAELPGA